MLFALAHWSLSMCPGSQRSAEYKCQCANESMITYAAPHSATATWMWTKRARERLTWDLLPRFGKSRTVWSCDTWDILFGHACSKIWTSLLPWATTHGFLHRCNQYTAAKPAAFYWVETKAVSDTSLLISTLDVSLNCNGLGSESRPTQSRWASWR